jgi:uncharacterized protein (TIGR03382 family)
MRDAKIMTAVGAMALLAGWAAADVYKVADSFEDYQGNQGENGWTYGYYDGNVDAAYTPADFELMTSWDDSISRWWVDNTPGGSLALVDSVFMHSWVFGSEGVSNDQWAVRRWTSTIDGPVEIDIDMLRGPSNALGDGVRLHVFVDGVKQAVLGLDPANAAGVSLMLFQNISVGSVIDFALDPIDNPSFDGTRFNAIITSTVPSPSSMALFGLGVLAMGRRRR